MLLLSLVGRASAIDAPPPQPRERVAQGFLWIPRVLLAPLRLLVWGLSFPVRGLAELESRHHVLGFLAHAFTTADGKIGVRPEASWELSFTPMIGLRFFDERLFRKGAWYDVLLTSGGLGNVHFASHFQPFAAPDRLQLGLTTEYWRRNNLLYTGLGAAAPPLPGALGRARYSADTVDVHVEGRVRWNEHVRLTGGTRVGYRRFGDGVAEGGERRIAEVYCVRLAGRCTDQVSEKLVPGFDRGTQFLRSSLGLELDTRDSRGRPAAGLLALLGADYTHGFAGDASSYFRLHATLEVPIDLWHARRVLVLRASSDLVLPLGETPVPFSELIVLGGPESLRGFLYGSFRDYSALVFTAEYRWPMWMWADATLFVDWGGVFGRHFSGISPRRMQPDVGLGLRFVSTRRFYLRAELAYGFGGGFNVVLTGSSR